MEALVALSLAPKKPRPFTDDLIRERDSWRRVAKAAMRALRSKDFRAEETLQPGGLWILKKDRETFRQAMQGSHEGVGGSVEPSSNREKSVWVWAKPGRPRKPKSFIPAFILPRPHYPNAYEEREAWIESGYSNKTYPPFRRTFPLEILLLIGSECDQPTLGHLTQTCFACLELFTDRLHRKVELWADSTLRLLLPERTTLPSARISPHLNLQNLRVLEIAYDLTTPLVRGDEQFASRLEDRGQGQMEDNKNGSLQLDSLVIFFNPVELQKQTTEPFECVDFQSHFLSLLNPSHLVVGIISGKR